MNYLERVLKIKIRYAQWEDQKKLPYLITDRYQFRIAWLDACKVLFVYAGDELDPLPSVKKQLEQIQKMAKMPVVLILGKIPSGRRDQLIHSDIPFVVSEQQIYLPFLGIVLQERYAKSFPEKEGWMPSAQLLLLFLLQNRMSEVYLADLSGSLSFSAMTISRASRQLESAGLIAMHKEGVRKVVTIRLPAREVFEKARPFLTTPIKKTIFINKNDKMQQLPLSGYSALSEDSMLNPPQIPCYACAAIPAWAEGISNELLDAENQIQLEIWKYDPSILAKDGKVGVLPLLLTLQDDQDERVQLEADAVLQKYWEENNGSGI